MKLTKLMLSAFVAALAITACNKQEHTPESDGNLKTINVSFQNAVLTKGDAGAKINHNTPVKVNNFKIFLTDESFSSEYSAMDENAANPAQFYWTANSLASGEMKASFHFVDHKCTRVVAIANAGNLSFADLKKYSVNIGAQQNQDELVLLAFDELDGPDGVHENTATGKYTEVYKANLTLMPLISRFEIDGFNTAFSTPDPKFNKIEVTDVAFQHYYPTAAVSVSSGVLSAAGTGTHVKPIEDPSKEAQVLPWFANSLNTGWFRDSFTGLVMTPDQSATAQFENRADCDPRAYHFFSGDLIPTLIIKLKADDQVSYVYTDKFKSNTTGDYLTKLEPGKIYRMKAEGEVANDGSIIIPDDIDPIKRCLDITVEVVDWTVDLVTPEF